MREGPRGRGAGEGEAQGERRGMLRRDDLVECDEGKGGHEHVGGQVHRGEGDGGGQEDRGLGGGVGG